MSADIALWDPEINGFPRSYEEATAIYLKLSDGEKSTSNSKLIKFASMFDVLLKDSELDQDLRHCYESIQRYAQQNQLALYTVGLPQSGSIDALKKIVENAQAAGIIVFYDMMGAVFLPDGQVFPEDKAEMWRGALAYIENPPDFPRTLKGFKKLADPLFTAMAERHGMRKVELPFIHDTMGYVREVTLGQQYLTWNLLGSAGEYKIEVRVYFYNYDIFKIYDSFDFYKNMKAIGITLPHELSQINVSKYKEFTQNPYSEITNHQSLKNVIDFFEYYTFSEILDPAQDIKGFDKVYNYKDIDDTLYRIDERKNLYSPCSLILARLVGNPRFEEMVAAYEADPNWGANRKAKVTEFPKLLDFLRNQVKPIV